MKHGYVWLGVLATVGLGLLDAELGSVAAALRCKTAADCGGAPATCELTTYTTCAGKDPACPAGSACGEKPTLPEQSDCAPYVEGICHRADELPCRVDADCGVGFRCAEQIGMSCFGTGSTGGPGVAPSWHEECHVSRGTFGCELSEAPCDSDRACAAGLHCQQADRDFCHQAKCELDPSCEKGLRCQIRGESYCWTSFALPLDQDVAQAIDDCTTSPPTLCAPAGYFSISARDSSDAGVASDDGVRVDTASGGTQTGDENAPTAAGAPVAQASGDGCSLEGSAGRAQTGLGWLALVGMLLLADRRRAGRR